MMWPPSFLSDSSGEPFGIYPGEARVRADGRIALDYTAAVLIDIETYYYTL